MNNTDHIVSLRAKLAEIETGKNLDEASVKSKIANNVFGTMANTLGGEVASVARVGGKVWEPIPGVPGKYFNTANKAEQITAAELKQLQATATNTAAAPAAAAATTATSAGKGAAITNIFKKNPKLWAALTAAAAVYGVGSALQGGKEEPAATPAAGSTSTTPANPPAPHSGESGMDNDLKAQIDAMIKELSASKDTQVQTELKRIIAKYNGTSGEAGMPATPASSTLNVSRTSGPAGSTYDAMVKQAAARK